jgi:hypothetical protein
VESEMNKKSVPVGTKVLASLSVLNIVATIICIISILFFRESMISQSLLFNIIVSPAAEVFTGMLARAISGFAWLFVIANMMISLGMMVIAMFINRSKRTHLRNIVIAS